MRIIFCKPTYQEKRLKEATCLFPEKIRKPAFSLSFHFPFSIFPGKFVSGFGALSPTSLSPISSFAGQPFVRRVSSGGVNFLTWMRHVGCVGPADVIWVVHVKLALLSISSEMLPNGQPPRRKSSADDGLALLSPVVSQGKQCSKTDFINFMQ